MIKSAKGKNDKKIDTGAKKMADRVKLSQSLCNTVIKNLKQDLTVSLKRHRCGGFKSSYEILGIITEEYHDLILSVKKKQLSGVSKKLFELTICCIMGIASIDAHHEGILKKERKTKP